MSGHILVLNRWPTFPGTGRWDNELARCSDLIDHRRYKVSYLCDEAGSQGLGVDESDGTTVTVVPDFDDHGALFDRVAELIHRDGPFDHLIAFSEMLLDTAAQIRERFDIPGPRSEEVDRFRDKRVMKRLVGGAGLRVPRWVPCRDADQVAGAAAAIGFPLILKPVRGASNKNVRRIDGADELAEAIRGIPLADYEIEEFIDGALLHIDGVVDRAGDCLFVSVSRYTVPCLDFALGAPIGSVLQVGTPLYERCSTFALACLRALDLRRSAFHLEMFDTGDELVFLEVGARVPGADASYIIHEVYGVNLFQLWVDAMLHGRTEPWPMTASLSGGWFTVPGPRPLPRRVVSASSLLGRVPFLYREQVAAPGTVLKEVTGYINSQAGRFLFRGGSTAEITEAIQTAQSQFTLTTTTMEETREWAR